MLLSWQKRRKKGFRSVSVNLAKRFFSNPPKISRERCQLVRAAVESPDVIPLGEPYDSVSLDEEILHKLKDDDKTLGYLCVHVVCNGDTNPNYQFDPLSIDWESEGRAISENTHLRWMDIEDINQTSREELNARDQRVRIRNSRALYRAVALNRSIKSLEIKGNITRGLDIEDVVSILTPFLKHNSNLCFFELGGFTLSSRTVQLLASALSSCTKTLSSFGLKDCDDITMPKMLKILDAKKSSPNITSLSLDENDISDEVAATLGNALPTLGNLKSLSLTGDDEMRFGSIGPAGIEALLEGLNSSSLEELSFHRNLIGPNGGLILAEALSSNTVLKKLDLTNAVSPDHREFDLTNLGWENFFKLLQTSALNNLDLGGNRIGDEQIEAFAESLNAMHSLETLDLWELNHVSASGWTTFFALLKRNSSLRSIRMYINYNVNEDLIFHAICDKTSIKSIYNSNHTLEKVKGSWDFRRSDTSECKSPLKMNEGRNKAEVARQKIIQYHFLNGDNLHKLDEMEVGLMPRVLEPIFKDELQLGYILVRSMPLLFAGKAVGRKRRRELS